VLVRLRYDPRTREYMQRRTKQGLSKPEIIRCLKRYVTREVFNVLTVRSGENPPVVAAAQLSRAA
ncbi:MAG: IS110 family transposase, partial [Mycobacteriales bacterium]